MLIRKRHGRVVRGLAVFFLLFTGADLLLPQYFCGEGEIGGLPFEITASATRTPERAGDGQLMAASRPEDSRPDQQPDKAPHDEDCFCCCAHILPGLCLTNPGASEMKSPSVSIVSDSLPSPPVKATYHPPRIA